MKRITGPACVSWPIDPSAPCASFCSDCPQIGASERRQFSAGEKTDRGFCRQRNRSSPLLIGQSSARNNNLMNLGASNNKRVLRQRGEIVLVCGVCAEKVARASLMTSASVTCTAKLSLGKARRWGGEWWREWWQLSPQSVLDKLFKKNLLLSGKQMLFNTGRMGGWSFS